MPPENKGRLRVESFERNENGSYSVGLAGKQSDSVWVAQVSRNDGEQVMAQYLPVPFGGGMTDPFGPPYEDLAGNPIPVDECLAYVWKFPDTHTPISETLTFAP